MKLKRMMNQKNYSKNMLIEKPCGNILRNFNNVINYGTKEISKNQKLKLLKNKCKVSNKELSN